MGFFHEGKPSIKSERKEDYRPNANKERRFLKSSNVSASPNAKQQLSTSGSDGTQTIWNCPIFKRMDVTNCYAEVRKERLCYGCLGKGMQTKIIKSTRAVKMDVPKAQHTATLRKPNG